MQKILTALLLGATLAACQQERPASAVQKHQQFLTPPQGYVAYRASQPPVIDGRLDEADWLSAPWTEPFGDISGEGHPAPRFLTHAKMLWDDDFLYVAAELEEPNVWAYLTERDSIVYHDPDFEVFIDPDDDGHNYFEIEVNALATLFDLFLEQPYRTPTRGFVTFAYDMPGLQVATDVQGTLNHSADTDQGWTVEMAIPRKAIAAEWDNYLVAGHYLRVGFSRVEWQTSTDEQGHIGRKTDAEGHLLAEDNWTWGPTGMVAMHMPERWGYVYLSAQNAQEGQETFSYPAHYPTDRLLWALFYEQEKHYAETGRYLSRLSDFHLTAKDKEVLPKGTTIRVETTARTYEITMTDPQGQQTIMNQTGQIIRKK